MELSLQVHNPAGIHEGVVRDGDGPPLLQPFDLGKVPGLDFLGRQGSLGAAAEPAVAGLPGGENGDDQKVGLRLD